MNAIRQWTAVIVYFALGFCFAGAVALATCLAICFVVVLIVNLPVVFLQAIGVSAALLMIFFGLWALWEWAAAEVKKMEGDR